MENEIRNEGYKGFNELNRRHKFLGFLGQEATDEFRRSFLSQIKIIFS